MFFMSTWWGDSKNMEEIEFSRWLFEGRPRQGKNVLPDGLNWLCYFAGSSKSHRENSISCIFLESPHQVDMKNVVKCYKQFFCYFNTLKTHCEMKYVVHKTNTVVFCLEKRFKPSLWQICLGRSKPSEFKSIWTNGSHEISNIDLVTSQL